MKKIRLLTLLLVIVTARAVFSSDEFFVINITGLPAENNNDCLISQYSNMQPTKGNTAQKIDISRMERLIFKGVNNERVANGLMPVDWNARIAMAARNHSNEMAQTGQGWFHMNSKGEGVMERLNKVGIYGTFSENVATAPFSKTFRNRAGAVTRVEYDTIDHMIYWVVKDWMNSPGHRANILTPGHKESGLGIAKGFDKTFGEEMFYITQDFYSSP